MEAKGPPDPQRLQETASDWHGQAASTDACFLLFCTTVPPPYKSFLCPPVPEDEHLRKKKVSSLFLKAGFEWNLLANLPPSFTGAYVKIFLPSFKMKMFAPNDLKAELNSDLF